jgi:hypothetical protein
MQKIIMLGLCAMLLAGCEKEAAEGDIDNSRYQQGYDMGHAAGVLEEKAQLCSEIQHYDGSIATALKGAGICLN